MKEARWKKSTPIYIKSTFYLYETQKTQLVYSKRKHIRCYMGNGRGGSDWLQRGRRKLLGVMDRFTVLFVVMVLQDIHTSKLIKLYNLNMCSLNHYFLKGGRVRMGFKEASDCHQRSNFFPILHCASWSGRQKASPDWQGISKQDAWDLKFTPTEYA